MRSLTSTLLTATLPCDLPSKPSSWLHAGPGGYANSNDPLRIASAGAAQALVPVPGGAWLLATANGGIWRTNDILAKPEPHWSQVLDGQPVSCTSISAMESLDDTVLAGCGSATSSEMGFDWMSFNSGDWGGLMISRNGGQSFSMSSFPINYYITAIVIQTPMTFHVAARANFYDKSDGGVWHTVNGGESWTRTLGRPVYDLVLDRSSGRLLAALPWTSDSASVLVSSTVDSAAGVSSSSGLTTGSASPSRFVPYSNISWEPFAEGISWDGRTPFYPTLALGASTVFVGALTVSPRKLSDTASAVFARSLSDLRTSWKIEVGARGSWSRVEGAPARLDLDGMPKDRMALLVHPHNDSMLFVAGNAEALVWRVDWQAGLWVESSGASDTVDGSSPHADCRRYVWEPSSSSLIVLSDGGAFLRTEPDMPGGRWRSLAGDTGAMEFVSAHWDPTGKRWVGGAQDNTVMFALHNASATDRAIGFIFGDGTVTAVDAAAKPSPRLWGATQNLGNFVDDDMRPRRRSGMRDAIGGMRRVAQVGQGSWRKDGGEDATSYGFGFWQDGRGFVGVPLLRWFSTVQFPFFSQPFALLSTDPSTVMMYAGSGSGSQATFATRGIYRISVPYSVSRPADISPPALELATEGDVYTLIAGGMTAGKSDPSVLIGMNDTHMLHRSAASHQRTLYRKLPSRFARPIVFDYVKDKATGRFEYVLGPTSHDKTVSLAASPVDSALVALTGWTSLLDNRGKEAIWVSSDAGATFIEVTADLRAATGTIGQIRPSALLLVPLPAIQGHALLVGTAAGVYVTILTQGHEGDAATSGWSRFGACSSLPLVLVAGLSHEPKDDTLIAATMGRGVYVVHNATPALMLAGRDVRNT